MFTNSEDLTLWPNSNVLDLTSTTSKTNLNLTSIVGKRIDVNLR
jgi:hypothetical protein